MKLVAEKRFGMHVHRRLALAAEKSDRVLSELPITRHEFDSSLRTDTIDSAICEILRGERCSWPQDWSESYEGQFLERVAYHGLSALLNEVLSKPAHITHWPHPLLHAIADQARSEASYDLLRGHWSGIFFRALKDAGIQFVVIKGEAVARLCYARSYYRSRSDTDVFIRAADIENVRKVMKSLGIEAVPPFYKTHQFSGVVGMNTLAPVIFDIHWRISNSPAYALLVGFEKAWERSVAWPGINECRSLNLVDSMLLACVHRWANVNHDPNKLIWLMDIHLLATRCSDTDWQEFSHLVSDNHLESVCLEGLEKSRECLGTDIPQQALDRLKNPLVSRERRSRFSGSNLSLWIEDLRSLTGIGSRASLLQELFIPHPDILLKKFGKSNRIWLPWLYFRQIFVGMIERLSLK